MASTFWKWLVPGLVTVVGGTALALVQTSAAVTDDLGSRATAALDPVHFGWARVSIDGRDVVLSGIATTQKAIDDAVARVSSLRGVLRVDSKVALAEFVSPFPFAASLTAGKVTLTGGYPDEAVHAALVASAGPSVDQTGLFSGAPARFEATAKFALAALTQLDQGEARLADLSLSVEGRAKSAVAYDSLQQLANTLPPGVQLAALKVIPPLASPFEWRARFDGTTVSISGDTPSTTLRDRLRAATPANVPISGTLQLSSGEPSAFAGNALVLLSSLLKLESGEVSISDRTIVLSGAPSTTAIADQVTAAIAKIGGTVTLEPPRVADYAMSVEKVGGKLLVAGFVPNKALREKLAGLPEADVARLALGRGAPEHFAAAVDFGLAAISHLGDGRFEIKGTRISLGGRASTVVDFTAAAALIAKGAPQGMTLTAAEIHPPVASPFLWSAVKGADGRTTLAGFVPDEKARTQVHQSVTALATDTADPGDGGPENFVVSAQQGLQILALLDTGALNFNGTGWSIEGTVDNTRKGFAADAAYAVAGLRALGWSYAVHLPPAPAAAPLPSIAPYVWRAQKTSGGAFALSGFAPAEAFQRVVKGRVPNAADSTVLGSGAPGDFSTSALAGLDALQSLDEGSLSLNGSRWTLTGMTSDLQTRDAIQARLSAAVNAANWQIAIQARGATPIVTPYLWSATRTTAGVELGGYVPNDGLKALAEKNAGLVVRDSLTVASGEPTGFAEDMAAAIEALAHLTSGRAAFDGSKWMLTGDAATPTDATAVTAALAKGSKGGALWSNAITGQAPPSSSSEAPASSEPPSSSASSSSAMVSAQDITSLEPLSASEPPEPESSVESSAASEQSQAEPPSSQQLPSTPFMEPKAESSSSEVASSSFEASSSAPSAEPGAAITTLPPMPDTFAFDATKPPGGTIALRGKVPADAAEAYFASIAGDVKADAMVVTPGLPVDFITSAIAGIEVLNSLNEGHLGFDGQRWWLRGKAETATVSAAANASIAALPNADAWSVAIDVRTPIDVCRDKVGALADRNAIVFQAGKAVLMKSSMKVLDELAGDLAICPDTYVHVQGHTDSDGDVDGNLALSVARAETVVAELIKRGVSEGRLYAEGYGESDPIVANDSKDNKARNRRIAFAVTEE